MDISLRSVIEGEIGSSTMPQKVNPIDFENAGGNAGIANGVLGFYAQKLPISRLQRDLSDLTVRRTFGIALGHTLLAWQNTSRGMLRLAAAEETLKADLAGPLGGHKRRRPDHPAQRRAGEGSTSPF